MFQWIPVFKDGSLQCGLFELPVMLDPPSAENRLSSTDNSHANAKWVDNKVSEEIELIKNFCTTTFKILQKPIFTVELTPATTVHSLDRYIDSFLNMTASLQLGGWSSKPSSSVEQIEDKLVRCIQEVPRARIDPLIKFLPLVLDKLLLLMVSNGLQVLSHHVPVYKKNAI